MSTPKRAATGGLILSNIYVLYLAHILSHSLTDARYGHVHKVGMLVILCRRVISLQSLKELSKNLLRDFTPSSF